jgi:hypothetical protein
MFPNSTVVSLKGSGHHTVFSFRSACSGEIVRHFLQTLTAGSTTCANHIGYRVTGVGRFPSRVWRFNNGHASPVSAANITVGTVKDAFERGFLQNGPTLRGRGLHGGTFHGRFGNNGEVLHLLRARWVRDLAVTGTVNYRGYRQIDGTLTLRGAITGRLRVRGFLFDTSATRLKVTGVVGGRQVKITVPAT